MIERVVIKNYKCIKNANIAFDKFKNISVSSSHRPDVFFLRSLNGLLDMRLGILSLYSCNL